MQENKTFSTIRTLINRNASLYPDRIAMKEVEGNRVYTYRTLKDRANRMGHALQKLGAKKGDRIAILSQNSFEYMESALSVPNAGFIYVVCNFRLAPPEIAAVLSDAEPTILFAQQQFIDIAENLRNSIPSIKHLVYIGPAGKRPEGWLDYENLIRNGSPADPTVEVFEDDIAMLMYTSGTTGLPKGVMQTHGNYYHAGRVCSKNNNLTMDDLVFIVCPMYHITAHYTFFGSFYTACPAYIFSRWDVDLFLSTTQKEKLTAGMFATPMIMMLLDSPNLKNYDVSSWRSLWFAGAGIIPVVYKQFISTFGNILGEHHGTTESTGVTTNLSVRDIKEAFEMGDSTILESCGRASYDMEILIVDENGKPVPPGGVGEMIIRGPGMSLGYWRKEVETKKAFKGEWFHTEDVCSIDKRGYIRVIDRLKDMIITGGENVYPAEVEKVLHTHPDVKESCVIGTPHPTWGEAVTAVVVLRNGKESDPATFTNYCKGKVAGYKVPKVVHIVPELPRNAAGKILKRELREKFAQTNG
ncbi:MAG: Long-chain-fatty-acid--CoA ligase [Syntrophorhabdaceae bacterium PtaU1.Bin034]|nr:MAG: Long-chain-fatty-acid--CoA ligase [Syntrophorhabdaceae bacterium PtaU1.Bin034]